MTLDQITNQVLSKYKLKNNDIFSGSRMSYQVFARQEIMWIASKNKYSVNEIAMFLKKDPSSVRHGIDVHEARVIHGKDNEAHYMERFSNKEKRNAARRQAQSMIKSSQVKTQSLSSVLYDYLSQEVLDYCVNKTINEGYYSIAEFIADAITDYFFVEQEQSSKKEAPNETH